MRQAEREREREESWNSFSSTAVIVALSIVQLGYNSEASSLCVCVDRGPRTAHVSH